VNEIFISLGVTVEDFVGEGKELRNEQKENIKKEVISIQLFD
jgi:hypothetical protein